jgi:hypothetical protein
VEVVIINSTGPMGSTVIGSIIEKFDYINIPLRKLELHEYLVGQREFNDPFFMDRFMQVLDQHSIKRKSGGVSVKDRNSSPARQLIDKEKVQEYLSKNNNKLSTIADLYDTVRNAYYYGLKYKKAGDYLDSHIEYTTDIVKFEMNDLIKAYNIEFDKVFMINLHRDFIGWLESLFSQRFIHPKFKTRYFFVFHSAFNQYTEYQKKVADLPGMHVDFNELFLPNTYKLINEISEYIGRPVPNISWESEEFDLYGKLSDFHKTFNQADTSNSYISSITRFIIKKIISKDKISLIDDILVYGLYLIESFRFQIKYGNLRKNLER